MAGTRRTRSKWDSLRPAYRRRLESNGITRERYLSGEPLTGARGHAKTPEHPERYWKQPERYPEYGAPTADRITMSNVNAVIDHVINLFADGIRAHYIKRFDAYDTERRIRKASPRTRAVMLRSNLDTYRDLAARDLESAPELIIIDGEEQNPFWYH